MGLDWNPMSRPKQGAEDEFSRLLAVDLGSLSEDEQEALRARFHEVSEAPYETLGAPRVGHDAAADEWLLERLREQGRDAEFAIAREKMTGYYVLDLLEPSPGLPVYTSFGYDGVDRYTFRGKFLDSVEDIIGEELYQAAWDTMGAPRLRAYGEALLAAGRAYAGEHGVEALEHQREPPEDDDDDEGPAAKAHIIFSAARWCLWWAERGHGLEPYY